MIKLNIIKYHLLNTFLFLIFIYLYEYSLEKVTDYKVLDLIGKSVYDFYHVLDAQNLSKSLKTCKFYLLLYNYMIFIYLSYLMKKKKLNLIYVS